MTCHLSLSLPVTAEDKALIEQLPLRAAPSQAASPTAVTGALQVALRPQSHYDLPPLRAKEVRLLSASLFPRSPQLSCHVAGIPPSAAYDGFSGAHTCS